MCNQQMLNWALHYASMGWRVHPLIEGGKTPLLKQWQHKATTNPEQIREWFGGDYPNANIGIATGKESGIVVVDIDWYHEGAEQAYNRLQQEVELPESLHVFTGNEGLHIYFTHPQNVTIPNKTGFLPHIDIRGDGGYVVAPPSFNSNTQRRYIWSTMNGVNQDVQ